jgi:putative transposase
VHGNAFGSRPIKDELIFHADRGSQYACTNFRTFLKSSKLGEKSMSRKGNYWNNALTESSFKRLKTEWVYKNKNNYF